MSTTGTGPSRATIESTSESPPKWTTKTLRNHADVVPLRSKANWINFLMKTLVRLQSKNARIFSEGERPGTHRAIRDGIGTRRAIRDGIPAATCSLAVRGSAMRFRTSEHHVLWFRDSRSGETGPCIRVCRDELIETGSPPLQRADSIAGGSGVFRRLVHSKPSLSFDTWRRSRMERLGMASEDMATAPSDIDGIKLSCVRDDGVTPATSATNSHIVRWHRLRDWSSFTP